MLNTSIPLTKLQKEIMSEFYSIPATKVVFNKKERSVLWKKATSRKNDINYDLLRDKCPSLVHQINKSIESEKNIQSAVFSECVYAQTFANMLNLKNFTNCFENENFIPNSIKLLLKSYNLFPRYVYSNFDKSRMLIQAGGCNGIDSALITVVDLNVYTIEFKEPGAKTSEPDLPKYGEDGVLLVSNKFLDNYPQFEDMLKEQEKLNFFEVKGHNIHNFSKDSINVAVSNNYTKKYADVICTEDVNGYLVMLPVNQISLWADIEGEIRPAGRNHYKVWTPCALKKFLLEMGAEIDKTNVVRIQKEKLEPRVERGGNGKISGFKITPLFFIYKKDCIEKNSVLIFDFNRIRQLNPTIAGKMFFKKLNYKKVKEYYFL